MHPGRDAALKTRLRRLAKDPLTRWRLRPSLDMLQEAPLARSDLTN
jgi:hypothetical protein